MNAPDTASTPELAAVNGLGAAEAQARFLSCCGSSRWAHLMSDARPYASVAAVDEEAERAFETLQDSDWLEAFAAHARVGQPHAHDDQGRAEQAGAASATDRQLAALAAGNAAYEARFGHVFLICASGLDAASMLAALQARADNAPDVELALAAAEQRKITHLRLRSLLSA